MARSNNIIRSIVRYSMDLIPRGRAGLAFAHDLFAVVLAWCLSYFLRFNFDIPENFQVSMIQALSIVLPLQAIAFVMFGLYRGVWRFASIPDLSRIMRAVSTSTLVVVAVL